MTAPAIGEAEETLLDVAGVLLVVEVMLSVGPDKLTPALRDALATTVRLARTHAVAACGVLEEIRTAPR